MLTSKQKYYYVLVHPETNRLIVTGAQLPFYWNRKFAREVAKKYNNFPKIYKVTNDKLEALLFTAMPVDQLQTTSELHSIYLKAKGGKDGK